MEQAFHAAGAEKSNYVVFYLGKVRKVGGYGFVHYGLNEMYAVLGHKIGQVGGAYVAARKNVLLRFMLPQHVVQVGGGAGTYKNFTLPHHYIFLQVIGGLLAYAEILHVGGHFHPAFGTQPEEIIYGVAAGENGCGVIGQVYFAFPEIAQRNGLYVDEGTKINFQIVFLGKLLVGGIFIGGFGLGYQNR